MTKSKIFSFIDEASKMQGISELIINKLDSVFAEKNGEMLRIDTKFSDEDVEDFCQHIAKLNNKKFSEDYPLLDGNLSDGSRVNLLHKAYTNACHAITIRRYSNLIRNFETSPHIFGLSPKWIEFFKALIKARENVIISGGTGVGKTTFLNLLLQEISSKERIITIEDTRELQFHLPNVVRLESRPIVNGHPGLTIRELMKNALRMRPDRIIVGEVRGGEVFDLLQAMNTGHEGSLTSVHANSPSECLLRLENLYLLSGYDLPLKSLRYQISTAVDYIIQLKRDRLNNRIVHQVTEVSNMEGDKILVQDIGVFKDGVLEFTGLVPSGFAKLQKAGLSKDFFQDT